MGSDNDILNVVFPLTIMLFLFISFKLQSMKLRLPVLTISGFFIGLYSFSWIGWWYIFVFILLGMFVWLGYVLAYDFFQFISNNKEKLNIVTKIPTQLSVEFFDKNKEKLNIVATILVFFFSSFVFVSIFTSPNNFLAVIEGMFSTFNLIDLTRQDSIWPNVYTTVAELNTIPFHSVVKRLHILPLALLGINLVLLKDVLFKKQSTEDKPFTPRYVTPSIICAFLIYYMILHTNSAIELLQSSMGPFFTIVYLFFALAPFLVPFILPLLVPQLYDKQSSHKQLFILYLFNSYFYYTVLSNQNFLTAISSTVYLIFISVPFLIGILLSFNLRKKLNIEFSVILLVWILGTLYGTTKGQRFFLLILPSFIVLLSFIVDYLSSMVIRNFQHSYSSKYLAKCGLLILCFVILVGLGSAQETIPDRLSDPTLSTSQREGYIFLNGLLRELNGQKSATLYSPSINDAWVNSLIKIRDESNENAIISSWWDFGHWFKFWADRSVTFDGASQNDPRAHWIGKVLSTENESEAISILRVIACGGMSEIKRIENITGGEYESVQFYYSILDKEQKEIVSMLEKYTSSSTAQELASKLYCVTPPEMYLITSEDMVGKAGVWQHFGGWDFDKSYAYLIYESAESDYFLFSENLANKTELSDNEIKAYYDEIEQTLESDNPINFWISPSEGYQPECFLSSRAEISLCALQNARFTINKSSMEVYQEINDEKFYVSSISYYDENEFVTKEFKNSAYPGLSTFISPNKERLVFTSKELSQSIFSRTFYGEGIGLEHLSKFSDVTSFQGEKIIIWKVNWTKKNESQI